MGKIGNIAKKVIVFCLIAIIIVSGYNVGKSLYGYYKGRKAYDSLSNLAQVDPRMTEFTGVVDFDALQKVDPNVIGWLYMKDSHINYPVVQGSDNSTYLHRLIDGKYNAAGTLFVDYRCERNFGGFNTIIYGHNMKDGSMFSDISSSRNKSFFDKHKRLELITPDAKYHVEPIAFIETDASSDLYATSYSSDSAKQAFIDTVMAKSYYKTGNTATASDRLISMSTCVRATGDDRFIMVGKLVPWTDKEIKTGEAIQAKIDAANARKNKKQK